MSPVGYIHEDRFSVVCNGEPALPPNHCERAPAQPAMRSAGSQDLSTTGLCSKRDTCRYYQAGICRRGSSCPFAHPPIAARVEALTLPHPTCRGEHMFAYHPLGQTSVYRPLSSQTHPVFLWQPYLLPFPSLDLRYGPAPHAEMIPDYPDDKSDPSSAESSSTATSVDYQFRTTFDTARSERAKSEAVRGVASPSGILGGYTGCGYPGFPALTGLGRATSRQCIGQASTVAFSSPLSLSWQDDMKKKPLAYKTKPCKFYTENGKCSSGEKCTFIHDTESRGSTDKSLIEPTLPADAKLPPKPPNKYDDSRARGFYPVTWRVIGGGVMMGGQRQVCAAFVAGQCKHGNDCMLAHETELQTDQVGFIEPKSECIRKIEGSQHLPAKGTALRHLQRCRSIGSPKTQEREIFPSTTPRPQSPNVPAREEVESAGKKGDEVVVPSARDAPASPVHRRTQSMSMVLTSPPPPDSTHPNYAAEF